VDNWVPLLQHIQTGRQDTKSFQEAMFIVMPANPKAESPKQRALPSIPCKQITGTKFSPCMVTHDFIAYFILSAT
jgi:hypothetical protein